MYICVYIKPRNGIYYFCNNYSDVVWIQGNVYKAETCYNASLQ